MADSYQKNERKLVEGIFFASLLFLAVFVLWLPVFPTGDGPMHLYYANVFRQLAGGSGPYAHYYEIRHLVQPYCLHYYTLIFFEKFTSPAIAEKLFVLIILLVAALGYRFLARRMGDSNPVTLLWILPLMLSWPLGGGFLNFCLATGLAYWALGFWHEFDTRPVKAFIGYVAMLVLLVLSHPVPLLVVASFLIVDVALRLIGRRRSGSPLLAGQGWLLAAFVLTCLSLATPVLISSKSAVASDLSRFIPQLKTAESMVLGRMLGLFNGGALALLYRLGLILIAPVAVVLSCGGLRARWRENRLTAMDRHLIAAVLMLVLMTLLPNNINGSQHLADRMPSIAWPLAAVTAAGTLVSLRSRKILAVASILLVALTLFLTVRRLTPVAREQAALGAAPLPAGQKGIYLVSSTDWGLPRGMNYNVFYWAGARAFERQHAILLNSPWLNQTIELLKGKPDSGLLNNSLDEMTVEVPTFLRDKMEISPEVRNLVLNETDFILYADPFSAHPDFEKELVPVLGDQRKNFTCTAARIYVLCEKKPGSAS